MKEYVGIYIKTEKAQEQDGFGNKIKYHFHIKHHFYITTIYIKCNCTYIHMLSESPLLILYSILHVILLLLVQFILDLSSYTYKLTTEYNNFITLI